MTNKQIYAEMARRKIQFHDSEQWNKIKLWGLFNWNTIKHLIKKGDLKTDMKAENQTVWVTPSLQCWETKIKPLIEKYSLVELKKMAGW